MSGLPDAKEAKGGGKPRSKPRQQPAKPRKAAAAAAAAAEEEEEDDEMAEAEGRQFHLVCQPANQAAPLFAFAPLHAPSYCVWQGMMISGLLNSGGCLFLNLLLPLLQRRSLWVAPPGQRQMHRMMTPVSSSRASARQQQLAATAHGLGLEAQRSRRAAGRRAATAARRRERSTFWPPRRKRRRQVGVKAEVVAPTCTAGVMPSAAPEQPAEPAA